jgi:hypothetical protein
MGNMLQDIGVSKDFLNKTPTVQEAKAKQTNGIT